MTDTNELTIPGLNLVGPLRPVGEGDDPRVRLLGRMDLGDTSFHVEADQVHMVPDEESPIAGVERQGSIGPEEESHFDDLVNLAGAGEPFETIEIPGLPGRTFVLYVYPFCT